MQARDFDETVHGHFCSCYSHPWIYACYHNAHGLTFEVSTKNYTEARRHIDKQIGLCSVLFKYTVNPYAYGSIRDTAYSPVKRVSKGNRVAMLAGVVEGRFICETGITVRHFFTGEFEELEVGGGLIGKCCGKESELIIDDKKYTADMAAVSFAPSPREPVSYDHFNDIDIYGQIYQSRLWMGDETSILPETVVWMVNQDGELQTGKILRFLLYDKELNLYNVMQIMSDNPCKSFSKKGDSGCCIFLPPNGADHMVQVIGMVISKVKYAASLPVILTNGVWLGKVLPNFLKTLATRCSEGPHPLSRDDNLPFGLNFTEGLEFSGSAAKFENLAVQSLQPLCPANDTGVAMEVVRSKESGPSGGLFESYNCTPVECSEDIVTADGIDADSHVLENVDSGLDTLAGVFGDQRE